MSDITKLESAGLRAFHDRAHQRYEEFKAQRLSLNLGRGKPSSEQLDLSNALLSLPGAHDFTAADGSDCRNYGGLQGLPELRAIFAPVLGAPVDRVVAGNNSSLQSMHDTLGWAMLHGVPGSATRWSNEPAAFLCPVPGYDRHFTICEGFNIKMVPVRLTGHGPDMDEVERLVASDPSIKGMWCMPKYSNPTGEIYAPEVVQRLASMRTAAPDFRLMWDNAYAVHHLTPTRHEVANILDACEKAGHPNRAFVYASTSKITFAGGGVSFMASSADNMKWLLKHMERQSIGPDKMNQLRHARFLKNEAGLHALMEKQAAILVPKFKKVQDTFASLLGGTGVARWSEPAGGYFISLDVMDGCARRVIELGKAAGITVVPPGATYPHGQDPHDRNIRIAPSFPTLDDVSQAATGLAHATLLAVSEKILNERHQPA
jgi:DNA-binding transcriptional MocR family regulator